jgi:CDP-glucose 4,6-dehydratase
MNYLITGHTGFKGSWYARILAMAGENVTGFALDPEENSLFEKKNVKQFLQKDLRGDIRDILGLDNAIRIVKPDVVIHLAAQALVGPSYKNPIGTFSSNALGTANLLDCVLRSTTVHTCLVVTTDKVYSQSIEMSQTGMREDQPIGPNDPYSSSKAIADLWTQTIAKLNPKTKILIARSGNVIGSGDTSQYRLLPDLIRAWTNNETALIRNPNAIRPWQHITDCILGYQLLIDNAKNLESGSAWNFAPKFEEHINVRQVVEKAAQFWPIKPKWKEKQGEFKESEKLILDSSKARKELNWTPVKSIDESIKQALIGDWDEEI